MVEMSKQAGRQGGKQSEDKHGWKSGMNAENHLARSEWVTGVYKLRCAGAAVWASESDGADEEGVRTGKLNWLIRKSDMEWTAWGQKLWHVAQVLGE